MKNNRYLCITECTRFRCKILTVQNSSALLVPLRELLNFVFYMQEQEIWKDAVGYERYAQVSSYGRIRTKGRTSVASNGRVYKIQPRISKTYVMKNGYEIVTIYLYENRVKKKLLVHRLVAETFIPNPDNLPQINHKDENKLNNCVENLEWCTVTYNLAYGTRREREAATKSKAVNQYTKGGSFVKYYTSITSAANEMNGDISVISAVCRHCPHHLTAYGYKWEFA